MGPGRRGFCGVRSRCARSARGAGALRPQSTRCLRAPAIWERAPPSPVRRRAGDEGTGPSSPYRRLLRRRAPHREGRLMTAGERDKSLDKILTFQKRGSPPIAANTLGKDGESGTRSEPHAGRAAETITRINWFFRRRRRRKITGSEPPVKIGDKLLKRLDSWKNERLGFRSVGFGFRSCRTLILFRLVLISFRGIWKTFPHGAKSSPVPELQKRAPKGLKSLARHQTRP
jgi:hypothetical protein